MKKKGFTLIELLVVIAIIAMLLAILMPALGKVKRMAQRIVCATNLRGMGTAQMTYGLDYDDEFAVQGKKGTHNWIGKTGQWADPAKDWNAGGNISVAASLYLLVREADVSPASFICKSSGDKEFSMVDAGIVGMDLTEIWDFGNSPGGHLVGATPTVSYSYQQPYKYLTTGKSFAASGTGNPSNAIMADRNPWCDRNLSKLDGSEDSKTFEKYVAQYVPDGQKWEIAMSNSASHNREGQNVLFGDGHTEFMREPVCGYENDNIYTTWLSPTSDVDDDIRIGKNMGAMLTKGFSQSATDGTLVNDYSKNDHD